MSCGLVVDNFAGGGGASQGIEQALGRPVDLAVNHWRAALETHEANHPGTVHLCEDVFRVKPMKACLELWRRRGLNGTPHVALGWFSPDCTHHSRAKGGKPVNKHIRGLAWVAVKWGKEAPPDVMVIENVAEFLDWGPLGPDGRPDPERKGLTFRRWVGNLRGLDYKPEWRVLNCADYGAPTSRSRLFVIARRDGKPVVWPEPTHYDPNRQADMFGGALPWRTAAECIDWSIPCPSIFDRARPLAENTEARIAAGVRQYVLQAQEPFLIGIDHKSSGTSPVWSVNEPLRTITIENRHALVTALLAKHYGGVVGQDLRRPLGTITGVDHHSLIAASLMKLYGTSTGSDLRRPMPTITGQGGHLAAVVAFMVKYYGNEKGGVSLREPMDTITGKDRLALVTVWIGGEPWVIVDIGMRMLQPHELAMAQGFPQSYILPNNKSLAVKMIGNSVCPPVAEAIVRANLPELCVWEAAA